MKKFSLLVVWVFLVVLLSACDSGSSTPTVPPLATTPPSAPAPDQPLALKWQYQTQTAGRGVRTLQLSPDRQITYLLETDFDKVAELVALDNSSGKEKWRYNLSSLIYDNDLPLIAYTVADDSTLYLSFNRSQGGLVLALDSSKGTKKWEFKQDPARNFFGSPLIARGNQLFTALETPDIVGVSKDKIRTSYMVALDKTSGSKQWAYEVNDAELLKLILVTVSNTYFATSNQLVYLYGVDRSLSALEMDTGKVRWKQDRNPKLGRRLLTGYKDGLLLVTNDPNKLSTWGLQAISEKDGSVLWNVEQSINNEQAVVASYILDGDSDLYVINSKISTSESTLYRFDLAKGTLKWSLNDARASASPGGYSGNSISLLRDDHLFVGSYFKGGMGAIDTTSGKLAWQRDGQYYSFAASKNTLYTVNDKQVLGLDATSGSEKWSATLPANAHAVYFYFSTEKLVLISLTNGIVAYG